jgi:hypothetical protein
MPSAEFNYSKEIKDLILEELGRKTNEKEIFSKAKNLGYKSDQHAFRKYLFNLKRKNGIIDSKIKINEEEKKVIKFLENKKSVKLKDLLKTFKGGERRLKRIIDVCRKCGFEISIDNDNVFLSTTNAREPEKIFQLSTTEIVFGILSDPHIGSKSCQITAMNEFSEIMKKNYVKHVFCPGDLVAGYEVYSGQIHDVYAISAQEQVESVLLNLPSGFEWYVLGGNHDYSFIKRGGGFNIITAVANKRTDVHYVGFDDANIPILNNVDVKMWHPSGGVPYAVSYRLQKGVEQITFGELQQIVRGVKDKPTVRFVLAGHLHIQMQAMFGSIWGAQCGAFEGQTNYLKRKGLVPSIGGWIVKATLGKNGLLKNFNSKFYIFDEIIDDYKNYKHTIPEQKIEKPIFE